MIGEWVVVVAEIGRERGVRSREEGLGLGLGREVERDGKDK